jgi:hypothetical protein
MGWVARHLGASTFVYPGFGHEKHAAVAIQSLSGEIAERRYFAHTGWRKIEGEWAYLHAGGFRVGSRFIGTEPSTHP